MATTRQLDRNQERDGNINLMGTGMGQAPSGYGKYDELFANNPYRNLQYNKSAWQELGSWLGFRTDADRFQEEAQANAAEWDANVFAKMYDERYNSEASKAQRMREAGENPDLLGTQGVSEASGMPMDPQGMTAGMPDDIQGFATGLIGCFNTAIGMAGQFMQLQQMKSGIEGQNISNAENMMNIIKQRVIGMTPAEGFKTTEDFDNWKKKVEATLRTNYGRAFFKGTSLRRWNRTIDDFVGGLPQSNEQFKEWNERLQSAKDYRYGLKNHWDEAIEVFDVLNNGLYALNNEITENTKTKEATELDRDIEKATNELQYETDLEPGKKALAENLENEARQSSARRKINQEDYEGILTKHMKQIGEELDKIAKQGGLEGFLAEIILFFMNTRLSVGAGKNGFNVSGGIEMPPLR